MFIVGMITCKAYFSWVGNNTKEISFAFEGVKGFYAETVYIGLTPNNYWPSGSV